MTEADAANDDAITVARAAMPVVRPPPQAAVKAAGKLVVALKARPQDISVMVRTSVVAGEFVDEIVVAIRDNSPQAERIVSRIPIAVDGYPVRRIEWGQ